MASFIEMTVLPNPRGAEAWLLMTQAKVVAVGMAAPKILASNVIDQVMPAMHDESPIKTGALSDQTKYTREEDPDGTIHIVVFSDAQNVRTGYNYAHARAYGFTTRNGKYWTPPENPAYPVAAFQTLDLSQMSIFAIPG